MQEIANEDVRKHISLWYEIAVDEQNKELRDYKKRARMQLSKADYIPLTIEPEEPSETQSDGQAIKV